MGLEINFTCGLLNMTSVEDTLVPQEEMDENISLQMW